MYLFFKSIFLYGNLIVMIYTLQIFIDILDLYGAMFPNIFIMFLTLVK